MKIGLTVVLLLVVMALPLVAQVQPPVPYYVNVAGQSYGPYSMSDLMHFVNQGRVTGNSLVWRAGMTHWMAAGTLVELASLFNAPPLAVQPQAPVPLFPATPAAPLILTPAPAPAAQPICASYYAGGTCACLQQVWNNPFFLWY